MPLLKHFTDHRVPGSLAHKLRKRRFLLFENLLTKLEKSHVRILDVGGTEEFWKLMNFTSFGQTEITILNLSAEEVTLGSIKAVAGDARHMPQFADKEFDMVFSNSVIEHVGNFNDQKRMASEVQRVGKHYFIQTPNRHFPIEPHFLFPCFQFFPVPLAAWLLSQFDLGWYKENIHDYEKAKEAVQSIRLLTPTEMQQLFPNAKMYRERFWGLTKSITVFNI